MGDLASSAVEVADSVVVKNAPKIRTKLATLVLTGQGGDTNKVTAESLGFARIVACGNLLDVTNSLVIPAATDGDNVFFGVFDTDETPLGDVTTTEGIISVTGYPL